MAEVHELIDRLVVACNKQGFPSENEEDVPEFLWHGDEEDGSVDWRIGPIPEAPWLAAFESHLPKPFPPSFASLVHRYAFVPFEIGPIALLANTGTNQFYELTKAGANDKHLHPTLRAAGFIHFAKPEDWSYDPVCFDTRNKSQDNEWPIVRIDHEEVLIRSKITIVTEIAPSFRKLVESFLAANQ